MNRENDREKESRLLAQVAKQNTRAFEQLYSMLSQSVFHYVYRLVQDRETAEDVLIDVFSAVWKSAGNFKGRSRVKTWVFGIARNLAFNTLRKKRIKGSELFDETLKDADSGKAVKGFENSQYIQAALLKLSVKHREILDLVFFHEASYLEISGLLDIPENTVKTRVYYAKAALKKEMTAMEGI